MNEQLLSTSDLDYVRFEVTETFTDRCDIQAAQGIEDGQGGFSDAVATSYVDVPCRFTERTGRERTIAGRETVEGDWVLTVAYNQAMRASDRVVHRGRRYEVVWVDGSKSYNIHIRAILKRLS